MPKVHDIQGFAPIIPAHPKLLLLGTMPSAQSLQDGFYYAHPRNAFWPIIGHLLTQELNTVTQKKAACNRLGILVWDVLATCQREGSLDSNIKQPQANDFAALFKKYPLIEAVFFNGQLAAKLFKQQVQAVQAIPDDLRQVILPSSSPANARLKINDKALIWEEKLRPFL
ncbi:DNA-deoxyinosine glycosylase [Thiosulfatimonas sediminis]|uniref:DNA-deoxyinosine glycosylase n=1 Tax=Thiosulfatimonas sediminis TaxID=2675054 RepID=A0A6F8PUN3_9GAMM|nr:DNA-deoxyinosine glycosylase [Thiosulfatimonas sediminis]BBP45819.1 DNA-deoxyinosine glycosylase [Thiosulfatimonas sediminis]